MAADPYPRLPRFDRESLAVGGGLERLVLDVETRIADRDDIVIETHVAAIRNSSFDVEHKAFKPAADGERLAIEAWETRVWVGRHPHDPARLKSRPIPPVVASRLLGSNEAKHGD